jgi:hypothetical protein
MPKAKTKQPDKDRLVEALGRAIQSRRQELQLPSNTVVDDLELSQAYFRSIEAGLVAAPPNVAIPLAFTLKWDVPRVAELLSAIRYLKDNKKRRSELFSRGVAADVINASGTTEEVAQTIREYFELPTAPDAKDEPRSSLTSAENLPWMFQLTIRKMTRELSRIPFNVEPEYYPKFLEEYRLRIKTIYAYVSYTPWGIIFEESGFNFAHLHNGFRPHFNVKFDGPGDKAATVRRDLANALDRLTANVAVESSAKGRGKSIQPRLHVASAHEPVNFVYNPDIRALADRPRAGELDQTFRNAWLYELSSDDPLFAEASHIVGFIDNWAPGRDRRRSGAEPFSVPLSSEDAAKLVKKLWS